MSIFDIKKSHAWNYSNPDRPGYSETLAGVVVGLDNPQAYDYQTGKARTWDDGSPVRNIRMFVQPVDGDETSITFKPKSALFNAIGACVDSVADLVGHKVVIATKAGTYGFGNPRPWDVQVGATDSTVKLHKVPVIDYDATDPVTGRPVDDADTPF